jgi:hypothetical protein
MEGKVEELEGVAGLEDTEVNFLSIDAQKGQAQVFECTVDRGRIQRMSTSWREKMRFEIQFLEANPIDSLQSTWPWTCSLFSASVAKIRVLEGSELELNWLVLGNQAVEAVFFGESREIQSRGKEECAESLGVSPYKSDNGSEDRNCILRVPLNIRKTKAVSWAPNS